MFGRENYPPATPIQGSNKKNFLDKKKGKHCLPVLAGVGIIRGIRVIRG